MPAHRAPPGIWTLSGSLRERVGQVPHRPTLPRRWPAPSPSPRRPRTRPGIRPSRISAVLRLVSLEEGVVCLRWRDYAHGIRLKIMTLPAGEFPARFLLYVLPDGFVRIRHLGVLANRGAHGQPRAVSGTACRPAPGASPDARDGGHPPGAADPGGHHPVSGVSARPIAGGCPLPAGGGPAAGVGHVMSPPRAPQPPAWCPSRCRRRPAAVRGRPLRPLVPLGPRPPSPPVPSPRGPGSPVARGR